MIQGSQGAWELSQSEPHEEFLELCAAATTGDLSEVEQQRLQEHLADCLSCREAFKQYQSIASTVISSIASTEAVKDMFTDRSWSERAQQKAKRTLFERLDRETKGSGDHTSGEPGSSFIPHRTIPFSSDSSWQNVWVLYAAGILLFCALGFLAYRVGMHRGTGVAKVGNAQPQQENSRSQALEEQLSDAGHDHALANAEIAQRDRLIADLRHQMSRQAAEITELKAAQARMESDLETDDASKQDLAHQKQELAERLTSAENDSRALQEKLDSLAQRSAEDVARAKASDASLNELTRQLQQQHAAVAERDEMLAHDRDIREVMGARDLYIAEIYDVAGTGETKKPYGRVFYTRGKSLIFYAYDLDQQAELKRAGAFQAWGRRGPDRQRAVNLGIFYQDNATKKRWILRCDNPETLAQIDAVFVTIEPQGGSHKPSDKTLLFASLQIDPNHP